MEKERYNQTGEILEENQQDIVLGEIGEMLRTMLHFWTDSEVVLQNRHWSKAGLSWNTMSLVLNKLNLRCLLDIPMQMPKYLHLNLRRKNWAKDIHLTVTIVLIIEATSTDEFAWEKRRDKRKKLREIF